MPHNNDTDESASVESEQALPTTIQCAANMAAVQYLLPMAVHRQSDVSSCAEGGGGGERCATDLDEAGGREAGTRGTGAVPLR